MLFRKFASFDRTLKMLTRIGVRLTSVQNQSKYYLPIRSLESHPFDHDRSSDRNPTLRPDKLRITIPVPVQTRALKRHRSPKQISKELDKQKLKHKSMIISTKRPELNHRVAQTYGRFDKLKLGKVKHLTFNVSLTFKGCPLHHEVLRHLVLINCK